MGKYWASFKTAFRGESAYKLDMLIAVGVNIAFFFVFFYVWRAVYSNGGVDQINTYTLSNTITYYFITSIIFRLDPSAAIYLNWEVWDGSFTNELVRPYSAKLIYMVYAVATMLFQAVMHLPFIAIMLVFARSYIIFPSLEMFGFFLVSLLLSALLYLAINMLLHSLALRFGDQDANILLFNYIIAFLAGGIIPLNFLPTGAYNFLNLLPFKALFFVPCSVFLQKMPTTQIYASWLQSVFWIAIFFGLYYFVFQNGLKRYAGTGR